MRICYLVTVSSVYSESSNTTEIHLKMLTQARISTKDSCFVLPKHRFLADVCGWLIPKVAEVGIDLLRIRRIRVYLSGTVGKEWILLERLERMLTQLNKHQFCQKVKKKSLYLKTFYLTIKDQNKEFSHGEDRPSHWVIFWNWTSPKSILCMKQNRKSVSYSKKSIKYKNRLSIVCFPCVNLLCIMTTVTAATLNNMNSCVSCCSLQYDDIRLMRPANMSC